MKENYHSKHIIIVLNGELSVCTKQNTSTNQRKYAPALDSIRRPTSAIRRAKLETQSFKKRKTKKTKKTKTKNSMMQRYLKQNFGLQIASLDKGALVGLGISCHKSEPFTVIAKQDTAALVLSARLCKTLILGGNAGGSNTAATKVRHRQCAQAMQSIFHAQVNFAKRRSLELTLQLKSSARVINKAVAFRKKMPKGVPSIDFTEAIDFATTSTTPILSKVESPTAAAATSAAAAAVTTTTITSTPPKRPSTAGPTRLQSIERIQPVTKHTEKSPRKIRPSPEKVLQNSLQQLVDLDQLAAARFGKKPKNESPRYKSTTEYWMTVDNRRDRRSRPSTAPTHRRRNETKLLTAKEYFVMRQQRLQNAILGRT